MSAFLKRQVSLRDNNKSAYLMSQEAYIYKTSQPLGMAFIKLHKSSIIDQERVSHQEKKEKTRKKEERSNFWNCFGLILFTRARILGLIPLHQI